MKKLSVKIIGTNFHPVKRKILPFISSGVRISDNSEFFYTRKSNGLPPIWNSDFEFNFTDEKYIEIILIEHRLLLENNTIGKIQIPTILLSPNKNYAFWATVNCDYELISPLKIAVMVFIDTGDGKTFSKDIALSTIECNELETKPLSEEELNYLLE